MRSLCFFEAKLELSDEAKLSLAELLAQLNQANRKAYAWAIKPGHPKTRFQLTPAKLLGAKVIEPGVFTRHQASMIARKTADDHTTALALAKLSIENKTAALGKLADKVGKDKIFLASCLAPREPFEKEAAFSKRRSRAKKLPAKLSMLALRSSKLRSEIAMLQGHPLWAHATQPSQGSRRLGQGGQPLGAAA
jgi:hypothetical protein